MFSNVGGQFEKNVVGLGERVGVMLPESIQLRFQHAAPRVAADLLAAATAADPMSG